MSILVSETPRGMSHYHTVKQVKEDLNCLVAVLWKALFSLEENFPKADESRSKQKERATSNEECAWICQQWRAITTVAAPCLREYAVSFLIKRLTWAGDSLGLAHIFCLTLLRHFSKNLVITMMRKVILLFDFLYIKRNVCFYVCVWARERGQEWDKQRLHPVCEIRNTNTSDLKQAYHIQPLRAIRKASTPLRSGSDTLCLKPSPFTASKHTHVGDKANGAPANGPHEEYERERSISIVGNQGPARGHKNQRRGCAVVSEPVCLLSDCCHTHIEPSINTHWPFPLRFPGLYALNAHVLIADGHVRSQVEPLKMWPRGKGHPLMSKSFFFPFVGREGVRKCAH